MFSTKRSVTGYWQKSHRRHQGVKYTDSKGSSARKGLSEIEFSIGIIVVVVRVNKLDVAVVDELGDHGDVGAVDGALPL